MPLSIIRSQYTTVKGERTELGRRTFKIEDRHFHKEAKSQKAQLESGHTHGIRKDVKIKMNRKLT
ncbi:hypothetical protein SAMN02745975_02464 [Geosporobacter subterraneus DSM 17957]|uniref:Uncharacterized protein n=1 Tax=Geosporobacter subterraneus DSM 17957 TaxID=1121919 RepID=A0A1M6KQC3_9FIRM|nr:hypothetical protein SAMN02745975_02464 [Geosporobacter subterraneus DSM 17957]